MIWLYLLLGFTPWIGLVAMLLIKHRSLLNWRPLFENSWLNYLFLWSSLPIVFFTFAHNIISPYVLPAMPACAILIAEFFICFNIKDNKFNQKMIFWLSILIPILAVIALVVLFFKPHLSPKRSEKDLVNKYHQLRDSEKSMLIYYYQRVYSAEFYTAGKVKVMSTKAEFNSLLENDTTDFLAINKKFDSTEISSLLQNNFTKIASFHGTVLYKECDIHQHSICRP